MTDDPTMGDPTDGDPTDGDPTDGDPTDGDPTDGGGDEPAGSSTGPTSASGDPEAARLQRRGATGGPATSDALRSAAMKAVEGAASEPEGAAADPDDTDVTTDGDAMGTAGAAGSGDDGRPPARPLPSGGGPSDEGGGANRLLVIGGAVLLALVIVALVVALLPGGGDELEGDAINTGGRVEIRDSDDSAPSTTARPTTTTTEEPATTTTEEPAVTTTAESTTTTSLGETTTTTAVTTTRPPSTTTPPTTVPTPAELSVNYPRDGQGRMSLLQGGTGAVLINNIGGSPGSYQVVAEGQVTVEGSGSGEVEPGRVVSVSVRAASDVSGDPPQGTITVSGDAGVIVTIEVVIS